MAVEEKMQVNGLMLGWIVVKNLDESIEFYKSVCGLKLDQYTPEMGWAEMSGNDGMTLGIAQENDQLQFKAGGNTIMCINVGDIDVAVEHYKAQGATLLGDIIEVPGHVKMQSFIDKDGNTFQIVSKI